MHQILFQFPVFPGDSPGPPPLGLCPQTSVEEREGKGQGEGKGKAREGEVGAKGREREVCVIAVGLT